MSSIDKQSHTLADEPSLPWGITPALLAVLVAAVGKEVWDEQGHGTPDRIDALATLAGGAIMLGWLLYVAPVLTRITSP